MWMMLDGTSVGVGPLLRRCAANCATATAVEIAAADGAVDGAADGAVKAVSLGAIGDHR